MFFKVSGYYLLKETCTPFFSWPSPVCRIDEKCRMMQFDIACCQLLDLFSLYFNWRPSELVQNISGPHWSIFPSRDLRLNLIATYWKFSLWCKNWFCIHSHFIIPYGVNRTMKYDVHSMPSLKTLHSFILRRTKNKLYNVTRWLVSREEGKKFISFPRKFSEIFHIISWPCQVHHMPEQVAIKYLLWTAHWFSFSLFWFAPVNSLKVISDPH